MKAKLAIVLVTLLLATSSCGILVQAQPNGNRIKPGDLGFSGPHFNLNVHGVPDGVDKFVNDSVGSGRHSVFAPLQPENFTLWMAMANPTDKDTNWTVVDCDATVDNNISIILPSWMWVNVTTGPDTWEWQQWRVYSYNVYVVGLGKPSMHNITLYPEAIILNDSNQVFYSWGSLNVTGHGSGKTKGPGGGQPNWVNATDLFLVTATIWNATSGTYEDYVDEWVFNLPLEGYWWGVTNEDVRLMQIRFYPVFTKNG